MYKRCFWQTDIQTRVMVSNFCYSNHLSVPSKMKQARQWYIRIGRISQWIENFQGLKNVCTNNKRIRCRFWRINVCNVHGKTQTYACMEIRTHYFGLFLISWHIFGTARKIQLQFSDWNKDGGTMVHIIHFFMISFWSNFLVNLVPKSIYVESYDTQNNIFAESLRCSNLW